MNKEIERYWIYGQYEGFYEFNFEEDERPNSNELYEAIIGETLYD